MPRNSCKICEDARCAAINAALLAGQQVKDVAAQFNVSRFSAQRHRSRHLNPVPALAPDSAEAEAEQWRQRANELWNAGIVDADLRAQADACRIGLRSVELRRKVQAEQETKPVGDDSNAPVTIAFIDALVKQYFEENPEHQRAFAVQNRCLKDRVYLEQCEALAKETN
jgi:hypothetical protein